MDDLEIDGNPQIAAPNNANKITTSCKKWINQAQPKPRVSNTDFAISQPKKPAISTPIGPPGVPK